MSRQCGGLIERRTKICAERVIEEPAANPTISAAGILSVRTKPSPITRIRQHTIFVFGQIREFVFWSPPELCIGHRLGSLPTHKRHRLFRTIFRAPSDDSNGRSVLTFYCTGVL